MKVRFITLFASVIVLFLTAVLHSGALAQRITCEVVIYSELLPQEEQQYLKGLDQKLKRAVESYKWTDGRYNYELPIRIEIFFEKYGLYGAYHKYGAGLMIATQKGIQMRDRRCDFRLNLDQKMHFGDPYDTFTGIIEFYIRICLGFDADRSSELGGQPDFEHARTLSEKARFENKYYQGWDSRRELVEDIINRKSYINMRKAAFFFEGGVHFLKKNENETSKAYFSKSVEYSTRYSPKLLELRREGHIIRFIDIKKLASSLKELEAFDLLDQLAEWDPEHVELYK